ncbi:sulfatase [Oleomonas cavernae]|uniref:Sulfatase n=1 Tax=Oleomonas cavernae TaxID=2320859 RepID=A0A418WC64_9PROT|nr:sulfatase [Oleomonas cavernae]RJF87602.1 sulfatase [Oleomonas cavernae]
MKRAIWAPLLAGLVVFLALVLPDRWDQVQPQILLQVPLELPVLVLLFALLPWRFTAFAAGLLLALLVTLKFADMGAQQFLGRPFNLVLDSHLLGPGWVVFAAAAGWPVALAAAAGTVAALGLLAFVLVKSMVVLARLVAGYRRVTGLAAAALTVAGAGLMAWPSQQLVAAGTSRLALTEAETTWASIDDLVAFGAEAAVDPFRAVPPDQLLSGLAGKDVLVVFVESYGRSALDNPWYADGVRATLAGFDRTLAAKGFAARSGFLVSPTFGGQSWLAHSTLAAGLRIDNQRRYDTLVVSDRSTLTHDFQRAGWRTVAVMPGITKAWPEAGFFGYDQVYAAQDLGYRGLPFDWVTMPDQFTLEAFDRLERRTPGRRPLMVEMALLSSHLPWTPLPALIPWDRVGDGRVFDGFAQAGDPPDVVWRDPGRVRDQYRRSIEYSLSVLASYIATRGDKDLVVIALGDHEPIALVSGEGGGHQVPVHVIAGDPAVLARLEGWGFTPGMVPAADAPVWPMEALRGRLLAAFTPAGGMAAVSRSAP